MSTIFNPLPFAAAARPASADPADVRLSACGAVVCITDSGDRLP